MTRKIKEMYLIPIPKDSSEEKNIGDIVKYTWNGKDQTIEVETIINGKEKIKNNGLFKKTDRGNILIHIERD